eukprot:scaffold4914_cov134-Skeletonema_marinoi.AAC.9
MNACMFRSRFESVYQVILKNVASLTKTNIGRSVCSCDKAHSRPVVEQRSVTISSKPPNRLHWSNFLAAMPSNKSPTNDDTFSLLSFASARAYAHCIPKILDARRSSNA